MRLHHNLLNVIAIGADEFVAKAIKRLAELRCAGGLLKFVGARTKTSIDAIEENDRSVGMSRRSDFGRSQAAGQINPVINVLSGMADAQLRR
jgi:hypothetical protein